MRDRISREADGLRAAALRMPQQAPPVDRTAAGAAAYAHDRGDGVQPNGLLSWLGQQADNVVGNVLPF
ncbi:hypothetical protein [Streptomyces roseochromogenus]|uniref:Uncharacterized protein n=1 Tax=Streptomyces roseochromogenus subsp. oscitans DS 12.976 TaxID=1352936 RepID=V6JWC4_STRRC|nr:hypothetical protein [Streptomyces roseochromogenus]EST24190.1 hypothetical protein M878_31395 [Streptomyces roseochromogenus subsp. oscitans DS 12.976]